MKVSERLSLFYNEFEGYVAFQLYSISQTKTYFL